MPCILFPDVPFFPDAFSCRLPHLSVPLLIRQNSAGSLSSNARRNTFGSPLPATTWGLTLSGTKTHVKQRFLPLTPLLMVS
ncbi:hypothetical protein FKB37_25330, partial [Klebsiella pneumoniae]|nr:hypothetical protein [Klebsiella pneumoniae]MBK3304499.1 hypothetical protein [Klebsiella pneumoniae]